MWWGPFSWACEAGAAVAAVALGALAGHRGEDPRRVDLAHAVAAHLHDVQVAARVPRRPRRARSGGPGWPATPSSPLPPPATRTVGTPAAAAGGRWPWAQARKQSKEPARTAARFFIGRTLHRTRDSPRSDIVSRGHDSLAVRALGGARARRLRGAAARRPPAPAPVGASPGRAADDAPPAGGSGRPGGDLPQRASLLHARARASRSSAPRCAWWSTPARCWRRTTSRGSPTSSSTWPSTAPACCPSTRSSTSSRRWGCASASDANASTSFDETIYIFEIPTEDAGGGGQGLPRAGPDRQRRQLRARGGRARAGGDHRGVAAGPGRRHPRAGEGAARHLPGLALRRAGPHRPQGDPRAGQPPRGCAAFTGAGTAPT